MKSCDMVSDCSQWRWQVRAEIEKRLNLSRELTRDIQDVEIVCFLSVNKA